MADFFFTDKVSIFFNARDAVKTFEKMYMFIFAQIHSFPRTGPGLADQGQPQRGTPGTTECKTWIFLRARAEVCGSR